jgi:hypothetical protein
MNLYNFSVAYPSHWLALWEWAVACMGGRTNILACTRDYRALTDLPRA